MLHPGEYHASWYSFLSVLSIMKCTFWWFSLVHQEVIPLENYWPVERNKKANGSSSQENRRMTHINLEVIQKPQTLLCLVSLQVQPRLVIGIFYVWLGALKKKEKILVAGGINFLNYIYQITHNESLVDITSNRNMHSFNVFLMWYTFPKMVKIRFWFSRCWYQEKRKEKVKALHKRILKTQKT